MNKKELFNLSLAWFWEFKLIKHNRKSFGKFFKKIIYQINKKNNELNRGKIGYTSIFKKIIL